MPFVKDCAYGKTKVKFLKKVIDPKTKVHTVYEMDVQTLLKGELEESYTKADNRCVVPTDTQKNTVHVFAKKFDVSVPEVFAAHLAKHFVDRYSHIHGAVIDVSLTPWVRLQVNGTDHPHSFIRNPGECRKTHVEFSEGSGFDICSSVKDILVLKSTGSGFVDFHKCEYTTLPEVTDRIFSTSIDCTYTFAHQDTYAAVRTFDYNSTYEIVKEITLRIFALDNSDSVQATMYKMAVDVIAAVPEITEVYYALPNKHYFEIDLDPFEVANHGTDCTLYQPQAYPSGYITCTIARD
ncbi:uricase [Schizosaccharomyces japonicus yFS275]|uniref:Uricase n=1 Tax=Schizosaccharomyces japonicus (strain yFS275 / FY16936) TaxID=402676 RepID=B6K6G8_SCHJY|nr:uricase [Schizosaccharomyces japonicus yFS275]EEB09122.1 uricase [Schizosaccharomyces japonicus yFS275]